MENQKNEAAAASPAGALPPKVTGIGGIFFVSDNPQATRKWYAHHLGLETTDWGATFTGRNTDNPAAPLARGRVEPGLDAGGLAISAVMPTRGRYQFGLPQVQVLAQAPVITLQVLIKSHHRPVEQVNRPMMAPKWHPGPASRADRRRSAPRF